MVAGTGFEPVSLAHEASGMDRTTPPCNELFNRDRHAHRSVGLSENTASTPMLNMSSRIIVVLTV